MSVSVSMPQLGESVTEGTVTRWLKREGEHVQADEPLLEVSTDKVDTEIPSPVSGVLRGITVAEDETVAVGAELAVIDEDGSAAAEPATASAQAAPAPEAAPQAPSSQAPPTQAPPAQPTPAPSSTAPPSAAPPSYQPPAYQQPAASYQPPAPPPPPAPAPAAPAPAAGPAEEPAPSYQAPAAAYQATGYEEPGNGQAAAPAQFAEAADGPYVTPLVRKLASEHGIDLATVTGTGVGGRIRKQDILDAAALARGAAGQPAVAAPPAAAPPAPVPSAAVQAGPAQAAPAQAAPSAYQAMPPAAAPAAPPAAAPSFAPTTAGEAEASRARPAIVPSRLRGTTERMSRARQVIAQRMVESLQTSAQLTTVVEADVTAIARLRDRAKAAFEAREGVKLSFLPFFALAAVEALKVHPKLNAVIDTASAQVTYHDAEHLGIAVDTERGLMVPVI
jgi:pyruvate dehydrogenase E2 component (dihydrolipoamide acetyltransferase)